MSPVLVSTFYFKSLVLHKQSIFYTKLCEHLNLFGPQSNFKPYLNQIHSINSIPKSVK